MKGLYVSGGERAVDAMCGPRSSLPTRGMCLKSLPLASIQALLGLRFVGANLRKCDWRTRARSLFRRDALRTAHFSRLVYLRHVEPAPRVGALVCAFGVTVLLEDDVPFRAAALCVVVSLGGRFSLDLEQGSHHLSCRRCD